VIVHLLVENQLRYAYICVCFMYKFVIITNRTTDKILVFNKSSYQ